MKTPSHTSAVIVLLGVLLVLGGDRALGQAPAGGGRQKLTFLAMGADGQPIADLQPAQVELKIDGKPRPMQSLTLVRLTGSGSAAAAPQGVLDNPAPPPYGSNSVEPSRAVLIAVDEESMRPGSDKPLKDALEQFAGGLNAGDRVGLVTMPRGTVRVDPTTSRTTLRDAIAKVGGRQQATRTDGDDICHARDVLDALSSTLGALGEGPTTVVVLSSGLVAAAPTTKVTSNNSGNNNNAATTCDLTTTEYQRVGSATASAHATVYIIQPETGVKATDLAGLQNLAGIVNSPLLNLTGGDGALTRVLRESAAYYVAEFAFDAAERDGKGHRVDLKVTAAGATVRGPSEVTFAKVDPKASKPSAKELVKEARIYTDLPLRAIGYVSKGSGDKIKVIAMVEPVDPAVKFSSVSIGLADPNGKMSSYSANEQDLARPTVLAALEVAPGSYRLHAAAVDTTGRIGSVDYQLEATLTPAGPMKMSGLSLGVTGPAGWAPKIEYKDEKEVVAFFELYGTTTAGISAIAELAATPDGPALQTAEPGSKLTINATQEPGRYTVTATFDLTSLKPGDYVIRATFTVQDTPPGKVFRTLRKVK
jgi:hypothetical protein